MRRLTVLIAKELRDQRLLLTLAFASAPLVGHGLQRGMLALGKADTSGVPLMLDVLVLVFTALLAADLGAQDETTGVSATVGRLPASPTWAWGAKVLTLALATALFSAWVLAGDALVRGVLGLSIAPLWLQLEGAPHVLGSILCLGFGVLGLASLLGRSLVAAALGVLLGGAVLFALEHADAARAGRMFHAVVDSWPRRAALGLALATLALASRAAYSPWRALRGIAARRAAFALTTLAAVIGPAAAFGYVNLADRMDLQPGDPGIEIWNVVAAPRGAVVVLSLDRQGNDRMPDAREVWSLDVDTAEIAQLGDGHRAIENYRGFEPEGRLLLIELDPWEPRVPVRRETWESAEDGHLVRVSSAVRVWQGLAQLYLSAGWPSLLDRSQVGEFLFRHRFRWDARDLEFEVVARGIPLASREQGVLLFTDEDYRVVRLDVESGTSTPLTASDRYSMVESVTTDGAWCYVSRRGRETLILDARTGALLAGPWEQVRKVQWSSGGPRRAWALPLGDSPHLHLLDQQGERAIELETHGHWPKAVTILADGRIVVASPGPYWFEGERIQYERGQSRVLLLDSEGRFLRTLYAPRGTEEVGR